MPDHSAIAACPDPQGCRANGVPEDCAWCSEGDASVAPVVEPQLPTELPSMSVGREPQQSLTNEQAFDLGCKKERQRIIAIIEAIPDYQGREWIIHRNDTLAAIKEHR